MRSPSLLWCHPPRSCSIDRVRGSQHTTAYKHTDSTYYRAIFTDFSGMSILESNKGKPETKGKKQLGKSQIYSGSFAELHSQEWETTLTRIKTILLLFSSETLRRRRAFFSYTRMRKTHWFSTKLSAEDKDICSVLMLQSKHWAIGLAPSAFGDSGRCVPPDNTIVINLIITFGISRDVWQPTAETLHSV